MLTAREGENSVERGKKPTAVERRGLCELFSVLIIYWCEIESGGTGASRALYDDVCFLKYTLSWLLWRVQELQANWWKCERGE